MESLVLKEKKGKLFTAFFVELRGVGGWCMTQAVEFLRVPQPPPPICLGIKKTSSIFQGPKVSQFCKIKLKSEIRFFFVLQPP